MTSMPGPNAVEEYWTGVASQLQVEADVFSRLVGHNAEMGRANEIALAQLVTSLLPSSVGVGTGVVIDSYGGRSAQSDIIVFEKATQPQIMAHSTQLLFPVESVHMIIEVKTTVDFAAIEDTSAKAEKLRALKPMDGRPVPALALFGYSASGAPAARAKELNDLPTSTRPDLACVLTPGLVSGEGTSLGMGLVPLHETDESGARRSREWVPGPDSSAERVARGTSTYPVSRLKPQARERYLFEPGRALLLFAKLMLDHLGERTTVDGKWLSGYLPEIALETVVPTT